MGSDLRKLAHPLVQCGREVLCALHQRRAEALHKNMTDLVSSLKQRGNGVREEARNYEGQADRIFFTQGVKGSSTSLHVGYFPDTCTFLKHTFSCFVRFPVQSSCPCCVPPTTRVSCVHRHHMRSCYGVELRCSFTQGVKEADPRISSASLIHRHTFRKHIFVRFPRVGDCLSVPCTAQYSCKKGPSNNMVLTQWA